MLVMKLLKFLGFLTKLPKIRKSLAKDEFPIKIKLEMFHNPVTPGINYWDKNRLYSQVQTEPDNDYCPYRKKNYPFVSKRVFSTYANSILVRLQYLSGSSYDADN